MSNSLPELPPELLRALSSFVTNKSHGSITLNFTGGRLVNFDAKIHSLLRSWPTIDTDKGVPKSLGLDRGNRV